jgi:putative hydrolase of the HAD superfamily
VPSGWVLARLPYGLLAVSVRPVTEIKAVVFDLDGTLLDHAGASLSGLARLLEVLAVSDVGPADVAGEWRRLEDEHHPAWREGRISFQEQRRRRLRDFAPTVDRQLADDELDRTFAVYLEGYEAGWVAYDDAPPVLARVRSAGLPMAVLTNGDQAQQEAKLRVIGLLDCCGPVLASSSVGVAKPHPLAYAAACAAVGAAPQDVLMVGDNYELDVLAPRDAGMQAVHLDRTGSDAGSDEGRITTLADLGL